MFSFEGFARINDFLTGFYRIAWLNILWTVTTLLGLVVFGIGPASYAMAKYLDRWFRLGETPAVAPTFKKYLVEQRWQPVYVGWILLAAAAVITVNLLSVPNWYVRVLNIIALVVVAIVAAYVFSVMAVLDVTSIRRQISTALIIGLGSLHWTIIGVAAVAVTTWALFRFAFPLLFVFGVGLPAAVFAFIARGVFRELETSPPVSALEVDGVISPTPNGSPWTAESRALDSLRGTAP